jgi:hypothetical protein
VPGNEAEVLEPVAADQPAPQHKAEPEIVASKPTLTAATLGLPSEAANDDLGSIEEQLTEALSEVSEEDNVYVGDLTAESLANQFGWSIQEMLAILSDRYSLFERTTQRKHGKSYAKLRRERHVAQRGIVDGQYVPVSACESGYQGHRAMTAHIKRVPEHANVEVMHRRREYEASFRAVTCDSREAHRIRELRRQATLKLELRSRVDTRKHQAWRFEAVSAKAHEPAAKTTVKSWLRAKQLGFRDRLDSVRRMVGLSVPDRSASARNKFEVIDALASNSFGGSKPEPTGNKPTPEGPDYTSSPGEVVRRYHRTIAH